ncbi:MAG: YegS/Rv2252/BmrU family lipid kinase [Anaerolineales bacterium]
MKSPKKKAQAAAEMLLEMQQQHKKLAKKMEKARSKVQRRLKKLNKVEGEIARLEHEAHSPQAGADGKPTVPPAAPLRPARLIFNPKSGLTKKAATLEELVDMLRRHGLQAEVVIKTSGKVARAAAKAAAQNKEALVIAAGGDGTIEDVATQLVGTKTVLGILPIGTRNNLARELGIPLELDQACALLGAGITRTIDAGRVRADEKPEVEYFLESAGIGLSAIVLPAGQELRKGRLAKLPGALRRLFEFKPGPIEVELDHGEKITAHSSLVTVSNAPLLGLNFMVAPDAKMDDGMLDIAVYDGMTATDLTKYFLKTTNGRRAYDPNVKFFRSCKATIRSGQSLPIASDADVVEERKVLEIEVVREALIAIVGKGAALAVPVEAVESTPPLAGVQAAPKNGNLTPEKAADPAPAAVLEPVK